MRIHIPSGVPTPAPDSAELAAAFDLGAPVAPPELVASGWGGHNHLWRLTTSCGAWAIKHVGRQQSFDPEQTVALELAAYTGGVPMPRPIPTNGGRCFAMLDSRRYRCHEWVDGVALPWHGHAPATAAAVGGLLARLHELRLPCSSHLAPETTSPGIERWATLAEAACPKYPELRASLDRALPAIHALETLPSKIWPVERMVGSHRDLHPTNVMRLERGGGFVLVDWDAAGPVVPCQEVACFALVFAERSDRLGYAPEIARAFIDGYRAAGGHFAFSGREDLAMLVQGRLWWVEQNLRLALAPWCNGTSAATVDHTPARPAATAGESGGDVRHAVGTCSSGW
jgi:Ser/Thr protein kinase RdoA (MazF antagonist)